MSYAESGVTVSDEFDVTVTSTKPEGSFTVTYYANGGYFGSNTDRTANQVHYQKQNGTMVVVSGIEEDPKHPEKIFDGWYLDAACTDGNVFTGIDSVAADISVYAKYKTGVSVIDESKLADALVENGLVRGTYRSKNPPADDANTVKVGDCVFWVEDATLRFYPNTDLHPDDVSAALRALGLSNAYITAIKRSDVRPDDSYAASVISGNESNTDTAIRSTGGVRLYIRHYRSSQTGFLPIIQSWLILAGLRILMPPTRKTPVLCSKITQAWLIYRQLPTGA